MQTRAFFDLSLPIKNAKTLTPISKQTFSRSSLPVLFLHILYPLRPPRRKPRDKQREKRDNS